MICTGNHHFPSGIAKRPFKFTGRKKPGCGGTNNCNRNKKHINVRHLHFFCFFRFCCRLTAHTFSPLIKKPHLLSFFYLFLKFRIHLVSEGLIVKCPKSRQRQDTGSLLHCLLCLRQGSCIPECRRVQRIILICDS